MKVGEKQENENNGIMQTLMRKLEELQTGMSLDAQRDNS